MTDDMWKVKEPTKGTTLADLYRELDRLATELQDKTGAKQTIQLRHDAGSKFWLGQVREVTFDTGKAAQSISARDATLEGVLQKLIDSLQTSAV